LVRNSLGSGLVAVFILLAFFSSYAQVVPPPEPAEGSGTSDTLKRVEILSTERYGYQKKDSATELLLLVGKVVLKQGTTLFYADSTVYNRSAKFIEAFGNVHINDNDSVHTY